MSLWWDTTALLLLAARTAKRAELRVRPGDHVSREHQQVEAEDRAPDIALERRPGLPSAAIQPEDPLEKRDVALNAGAEIPEPLVHPATLDHGADFHPQALGERYIPHPFCLDVAQVQLRGERAVEDNLPRRPRVDVGLAIDHRLGQRGVRGI